jgi:transcriptional regulator with XRE-family HTH domain
VARSKVVVVLIFNVVQSDLAGASNVSFDRLPEKLHSAAVQLERSTAMSRVRTGVDAFVGGRIKQRRKALAMSQTALGEALGVTFQQVQKYERGHNRVGAGALYKMADALNVPISYFFDGLPALANGDDAASRRAIEFLCTREGAAMVEALSRVPPKLRRELANHVAMVARAARR